MLERKLLDMEEILMIMVVIDMIFNIGITKFNEFKKTIAYIAQGFYEKVSIEMLNSAWAHQVNTRATELSNMMRNG